MRSLAPEDINQFEKRLMLREQNKNSEHFRMVCANLEPKLRKEGTLIMVTSPCFNVEHSMITAKLAIGFAEQGKKTLLIDAKFRQPTLHNFFHLNHSRGLANVMLQDESIRLYTRPSFVSNLSVLPAGTASEPYAEIWGSGKLEKVGEGLRQDYDVVLFDAPPLLMYSDSQLLAGFCDGVVLVIKERQTKKEEVLLTKSHLERANKEIYGVVYQTR
ncbi:CpsD/CapB family tyrosine-protein kinase [Fictibacillus sp. KU28468]|uniref:CpsD/CapB family tyrosine-protein kinase n=1 Tax=Fictibacillus sp. KU28468 TaxID=2991053 RepID=UPI00223DFBEA|nr:CpsD/CapB family tyrosine-protein kinase [Fictibacillus sp. KU28468]UZJ79379.1 CpsD/CapB family tyrosine-protein kinase [Fictibacillus sp. KU28468]